MIPSQFATFRNSFILLEGSYLDAAAFVKAKINNSGVLALGMSLTYKLGIKSLILCVGYTQALRPGVKASFGLALDTQRLNEANPTGPAHKVRGLRIRIEIRH